MWRDQPDLSGVVEELTKRPGCRRGMTPRLVHRYSPALDLCSLANPTSAITNSSVR